MGEGLQARTSLGQVWRLVYSRLVMKFRVMVAALSGLAAVPAASQTLIPITAGDAVVAELSANDAQRPSGKYEDRYRLDGRSGQRIDLRLLSSDFDAFLLVTGPDGFSLSSDDDGEGTDSRVVIELPADGTYILSVTSYRPGETGAYRFELAEAAADLETTAIEPAEAITIGQEIVGRLTEQDRRIASGEYSDRYRFRARRGQRVRASVASTEFDTYLMLLRPDGSQDDNDDFGTGRETGSRIDTVLAEDGDYVLIVTSFRPGELGKYRLNLDQSPGHPRQMAVPGGARVLALLVGVADYGGRTHSLPNTDEDARQLFAGLRDAGLLHPQSRILTNAEATRRNLESAFADAARAAGPDDLFLFFFSGHGDQVDIARSPAELDGRSETIELFDRAMTDVELGRLFAGLESRMMLVAIDACYAGGFRNLIDRPNVMGLFSSEEDLTSLVASQFKAGGFLAYFLRTGLAGAADNDGDSIVTAGELSTYVRRQFRKEGEIPARTREEEPHYQNLLVERGGVHVDDVIVRLEASPRIAAIGSAAATRRPFVSKRGRPARK